MTKKRISLFALSFLFCIVSNGQNIVTDSTATVVSYWKKGEVANYILRRTNEKYDKDILLSKGGSVSRIKLSVLDATSNSYKINWEYEKIEIENEEGNNTLVRDLTKLVQGINFIYKTNELGEFAELLNWKKVKSEVNKVIDKIGNDYADSKIKNLLQQTRNVFSSKENIELLIMKNVQLFHTPYGGEYQLRQKLSAEIELPNVLGGNPFPAILTVEMLEVDKERNVCTIQVTQTIDKEVVSTVLNQLMNSNNQSGFESFDIVDDSKYIFELEKGWVKSLIHTRLVEINGLKTIETIEFEQK